MSNIFQKLFSPNEREVAKIRQLIPKINALEEKMSKLSDKELSQATSKLRKKLGIDIEERKRKDIYYDVNYPKLDKQALEQERKQLLALIPEAFAYVREAAKRTAKHRHFDVQLITGALLSRGKITEMYTGEGKTNAAMLSTFLYGLAGWGVHVVTVNDYLAKRDAEWTGIILSKLGMTTTVLTAEESLQIISDEEAIKEFGEEIKDRLAKRDMSNMSTMTETNLRKITKKEAYLADVIYGQASEFGFDYLRDNMATSLDERVQRYYYYSIVDECDSILIDEARTPLIISMPDEQPSDVYYRFASIAEELKPNEDYVVDEKRHSVVLSDSGISKVEEIFKTDKIWSDDKFIKHIDNSLKAKALYINEKEYIVKDGEVLIVDQFTGRVQPGRRYSEGLHQAIEAKEGVAIKQESKTLATITYQNFFRMYSYLSGMTGTAMTEAEEFAKIYSLDVVKVPTYKPIVRKDHADVIYPTEKAKFKAVIEEIKELHSKGSPVLVGTTSIDKSEMLSEMLEKKGVPHRVLNAKYHEKEAKIISLAGQKGAVTIATNMAGRGTDIKLGEGVVELGGLHILGTERHESRRIDNQLRGRAGRLGDPGSSRFYLSIEDKLLRVFGGEMIQRFIGGSFPDDTPIESRLITSMLTQAQQKVESLNFDIRRRLVEYDDVLNFQRETVYKMRKLILIDLHDNEIAKLEKLTLTKENASKFLQALMDYSLTDPYNTKIVSIVKDTFLEYPLRLWVTKQIFTQFSGYLSGLSSKKKLVSEKSHTLLIDYLDTIIPNELQEKIAEEMGIKTYAKLLEKLVAKVKRGYLIDQILLTNLLLTGLFLQVSLVSQRLTQSEFERFLIMSSLDYLWMEHIDAMADLREGIGLRGYAQRDPLIEYKKEGAILFEEFFATLGDMISKKAYRLQVAGSLETEGTKAVQSAVEKVLSTQIEKKGTRKTVKPNSNERKIGRNDPCYCGSGKKYKNCHMKIDQANN